MVNMNEKIAKKKIYNLMRYLNIIIVFVANFEVYVL